MGSAVLETQKILNLAGANLSADGIWGRRTQAALDAASPEVKQQITQLFASVGKIPPWSNRWISVVEAEFLVDRASQEVGLGTYATEFKQFLRYEAPMDRSGQFYDVNAQNGSSRGLMQMQKAAWSDAQRKYPSLAGYDKVFDPYQNILAGIVYASINISGLKRRGFPVTGKNLYLAHNQGIGFFDGRRTAIDNQSKVVQQLIAKGPDR
jgi:hypothetical protein